MLNYFPNRFILNLKNIYNLSGSEGKRAMVDFLGFMFFSMLEGYAVFALTFYTFRIDLKRYFWPSLVMINLIDLQNYVIREDFRLDWVAPISNLIIMIFFITLYVRIPLIWAAIMSLTGYFAYGVIQSAFFFLPIGDFTYKEIHIHPWKVYEVQALTGCIGAGIAMTLYKFGFGFTFEFEKLRFKWERMVIIFVASLLIILLGVMVIFKDFFVNLLVFGIALFVFLVYSLKKEAEGR